MEMRTTTRAKRRVQAQAILGAQVVDFVVGNAGQNPTGTTGGAYAVAWAIALALVIATGRVIALGLLPIFLVMRVLSPSRGMAVTPMGVATFRTSALTGAPTQARTMVPFHEVHPLATRQAWIRLQVGHETMWLAGREAARLRAGMARISAGS